jgi:hypothetical protein
MTVSSGIEEIPSQNMPVRRLTLAILPLDLPYSRLTLSGEILTTGKLHKKKPGRTILSLCKTHSYFETNKKPKFLFVPQEVSPKQNL